MSTNAFGVGLNKDTHNSREEDNKEIIQYMIMRLEHLESPNLTLHKDVRDLTKRVMK